MNVAALHFFARHRLGLHCYEFDVAVFSCGFVPQIVSLHAVQRLG